MNAAACPGNETDEQLLDRFRTAGDAAAFEALVHRYEHALFGYLRRYLHDAEMAADVFQATFLQVYLKRHVFAAGRLFRPWLYAIATHQAIDAQRRNRRHRMARLDQRTGQADGPAMIHALAAREGTAAAAAEAEDDRCRIRSALAGLSASQRMVVDLIYQQGLKYREAALRIGIPVGTVKSRMRAAILQLAKAWHPAQAGGRVAVRLAVRGLGG